ncbi:MAG: ABC transporter substrate-binding protein [Halopseudomonas aestusnigri]
MLNIRGRTFSRLVLILLAGLLYMNTVQAEDKKIIYGVFWTGCENVCQALQDYIKKENLNAELIIRDVGRDKSKLPGFVKEARALKADVVVTWGTTTTLGITGTLDDVKNDRYLNDIPVVFTLVSDPVRSKIIKAYDKTGRANITGTRNRVPEDLNITIIRKIKPNFKRLGILYNQSEKNSILKVNEIKALQQKLGFELIALELDKDDEGNPLAVAIPLRVSELKQQNVDFIYLGSSVFLEDNMGLFTSSAVKEGIPILSPYETLVRNAQAYMSVAAREYDVGLLAGEQISKILVDGIKPGDLSVRSVDQYAYVINMNTAKKLKLFPPVAIMQIAEIVE